MKKLQTTFILCLFFALSAVQLSAQSLAWTRLKSMGNKGINLANWLEAGWLGSAYPNTGEYVRDEIESLVKMGFRSIRVPVIYEWVTSDRPPYGAVVNSAPFDIIDSVVIPLADRYGLVVILDNHHGKDLTNASYLDDMQRLCDMWTALTERYRSLPHDRYFFELRNEPTFEIDNDNLHSVQQAIIDSIRTHDADRTLIVGANWWNSGWSLAESQPYTDSGNNIIYTFHNYDPYQFTHQGFSWSGLPTGPRFDYPGKDATDIRSLFSVVKDWSTRNDVPVFLGEFGVSWFADTASRCNYITCLTDACSEFAIPWLYWDVKHGYDAFGIFSGNAVRFEDLIPCFRDVMKLQDSSTMSLRDVPAPVHASLGVYPNPASGTVAISFSLHTSSSVSILLLDANGREVVSLVKGEYSAGSHFMNWTRGVLPDGVYHIRMNIGRDSLERTVLLMR